MIGRIDCSANINRGLTNANRQFPNYTLPSSIISYNPYKMKFVIFGLLGLLLVAFCSAQTRQQCEDGSLPDGDYPHTTYCNMFYTCAMGYWKETKCYNGMWNIAEQACTKDVDCGSRVRSPSIYVNFFKFRLHLSL